MKNKYKIFIILNIVLIFLDQLTKELIERKFNLYESVTIIPKFLYITYIHNRGGAFGIFSNMPEIFLNIFFIAIPLFVMGLILFMYIKAQDQDRAYLLSLTLIFAGAIGNFIDRIRFNQVRDFIDVDLTWLPLYKQHWPAFNVADSLICIGIGLLIIHTLFFEVKKH